MYTKQYDGLRTLTQITRERGEEEEWVGKGGQRMERWERKGLRDYTVCW